MRAPADSRGASHEAPSCLDHLETSVQKRAHLYCPDGVRQSVKLGDTLWWYAQTPRHHWVAERIERCSDALWVVRDESGVRLTSNHCNNRQCPECANRRARQASKVVAARVARYKWPTFLTLTTTPRRDLPLREQIRTIVTAFNRLRRHAVWQQSVSGGIWVLEITRHPHRTHYHVHIHALMDSKFVDWEWLRERWTTINGQPSGVHIRRAQERDSKYLGKYMGKGFAGISLEPWEEWPFAEELISVRTRGTFGTEPGLCHGADPDEEQTEYMPPEVIAPLSEVIARARDGNVAATEILAQLIARYPWMFRPDPDPPPDPPPAKLIPPADLVV